MSFSASISVTFKVDKDTYNVNLSIPTAAPSDDAPFIFEVGSAGAEAHPLLQLAVGGGTAANENVSLQLSPPSTLLSGATGGKLEEAAVIVTNGDKPFDEKNHKFQVAKVK